MSEHKDFLLRHFIEKDDVFFNEIRFHRAKERLESKSSYSWENIDYKIYPSSLDYTICPHEYIYTTVQTPMDFGQNNEMMHYRGKVGTHIHKMFQSEALLIQDFLYKKPNIPKNLEQKLEDNWPEVPVFIEEIGLSGKADLVVNYKDKPLVIDIKTTSQVPFKWNTYKCPSRYKLQVKLYAYVMNLHNYYDTKIDKVCLAVVNLLMAPGSDDSEREYCFDLTEKDEEEIKHLLDQLKIQRDMFLAGVPKEDAEKKCEYNLCEDSHGR